MTGATNIVAGGYGADDTDKEWITVTHILQYYYDLLSFSSRAVIMFTSNTSVYWQVTLVYK